MRRPGAIGDLAYSAQHDKRFPDDPRRVVRHLRRRGEPAYVLDAARRAVLEFREMEELLS